MTGFFFGALIGKLENRERRSFLHLKLKNPLTIVGTKTDRSAGRSGRHRGRGPPVRLFKPEPSFPHRWILRVRIRRATKPEGKKLVFFYKKVRKQRKSESSDLLLSKCASAWAR